MRPRDTAVAVVLVAAVACSGVKRADDWHEHPAAAAADVYRAGPFDAMVADGIWGVGDHVAYAITVDDGAQRALPVRADDDRAA